jgi:nuclear pore complex protein Nup98-Nup96
MRISQLGLPLARLVRRMHRRTTHLDSQTQLTMHLASPISLLLMRLVNLLRIPGLGARLVVLSVSLRLSRTQIVRSFRYPLTQQLELTHVFHSMVAFGQPAQPAQNTNPFGSAFGQPAAQQNTGATGGFGGLFGAKPATPTLATGGFGFGQPAGGQQQQNNQPGSTLGGGGLFGQNNNNQPTNNNAGGLFGGQGLFGQQRPGGLLGNTGTNPFGGGFGQSTVGGFGATVNANPAAASTSANPFGAFSNFGQPAANANTASTSTNLFTQSTLQPQQQQQPSLTASVDQPFNSGVPIFELLPGAASSGSGFASSAFGKKKQSNFFMKRKPLPTAKSVASLSSSTAVNPLRGFASSSSPFGGSLTSTRPGQSGISLMLKGGTTPNPSSSFASSFMGGSLSEKKGLNSEVFANSPGRTSVKKLVLDKDPSTEDLSSALRSNTARKNTSNALELIKSSSAGSAAPVASRALVHKPADSNKSTVDTEKLEKGDYWISPTETVLGSTPFKDLEAVLGFKCGRVGYGQVEFLDPVNLTTVGAVKEIPGKFIIFEEKECTVYPDESEKPPVGQGLNVRAKITLEGCWATDRATREPIKSEDHPKHAAHLRKLGNMPNTTFDSFDIEKGAWAFIVEHFS